jgi:hypothetical protein
MPRVVLTVAAFLLLGVNETTAQLRVDKNVVYGMYSGLALLMDVYHPEKPNGYGVIVIPGSGWQAELRDGPLKTNNSLAMGSCHQLWPLDTRCSLSPTEPHRHSATRRRSMTSSEPSGLFVTRQRSAE